MDDANVGSSSSRKVTATADFTLFDIPFPVGAVFETHDVDGEVEKSITFTMGVGDRTLGEVLRYIVGLAGGDPDLELGEPWSVLDSISLESLQFQFQLTDKGQRYGFRYTDIGLDLTFLQIDRLDIWYHPASDGPPKTASSVDVDVYGTFLGVDFTTDPISWDALKEQPPATPAAGDDTFRLDYLGIGQHVTLRNVSRLDTIAKVMAELTASYEDVPEGTADPLGALPALTFDDGAAWLVGTKFSVMNTFELSAIWNLPALAGLRVALSGERAKSLAGLEFEILYRKVADDLGVYHVEVVLPDVMRRFQAGVASVTLPVIVVDIYTDGGFLVDLGFPHDLDFSRSFTIEMLVWGVPVVGSLGVYFGVLSAQAVPEIPAVTGGGFGPVITAGVGARIGVGKSIQAGILSAGLFIGIEGILEGVVAFYEPDHPEDPAGTFYRVEGTLQLVGHLWGEVSFAIIKAKVDIYAYVSAQAVIESHRATLLVFAAGVSVKLEVTVGFGFLSFRVSLSFSAEIREEILIGEDSTAPWVLAGTGPSKVTERRTRGAYRRLASGAVVADDVFTGLLDGTPVASARSRGIRGRRPEAERVVLQLYFHPIATVGVVDDHPDGSGGPIESGVSDGEVTLVASLLTSLERPDDGALSCGEAFVEAALRWALEEVREREREHGGAPDDTHATLSELHFLADDLVSSAPKIPVRKDEVARFLEEYVDLDFVPLSPEMTGFRATPFPMVPLYTLTVKSGDVVHHEAHLSREPACSVAYQRFVSEYFDTLSQNKERKEVEELRRGVEAEELSMAWLVFVDSFRMILRSIVRSAIEEMERYRFSAKPEQRLIDVVRACGLDMDALRDVAEANIGNASLWTPGSTVYAVDSGVVIGEGSTPDLQSVAGAFGLPLLTTARHLRNQPILESGSEILVVGGRYRIRPDDTRVSLEDAFGVAWKEIAAANPRFDWSVPAGDRPPYTTLELPAGSTIDLPAIRHPVEAGDTLQSVADRYGAPLRGVVQMGTSPILSEGVVAWRCVAVSVLDEESVAGLVVRAGLPAEDGVARIALAVQHDTGFLQIGAKVPVTGGSYTIPRGVTLADVAARFQTTAEAIAEVNADAPWKLEPRPLRGPFLPMGEVLRLPDVAEYTVSKGETIASLVWKFSLPGAAAFLEGVKDDVGIVRPLAQVLVPPVPVVIPASGEEGEGAVTPVIVAMRYGIDPVSLVLANQGAVHGQGSLHFDTVEVPQCERVEIDTLMALLAVRGESNPEEGDPGRPSHFDAAMTSLARFLLAGLRLPDPTGFVPTPPAPDVPLYPLYTLTGQQWVAPAEECEEYVIELTPDGDDGALHGFLLRGTPSASAGLSTTLQRLDWDLIAAFRDLLQSEEPLVDPLLSSIPYPGLQEGSRDFALGTPLLWTAPKPPIFVDEEGAEAPSATVRLFPMPDPLRHALRTSVGSSLNRVELGVLEAVPDRAGRGREWNRLANSGFGTRLEVRLRRVFAPGSDEVPVPAVYELVDAPAQTQANLLGLLEYLAAEPTTRVAIEVLWSPSPTSDGAGTVQSSTLPVEERQRVAVFKSNLSTFSRPSGRVMLGGDDDGDPDVLSAATLADPTDFLTLLWELSSTNSGGFYLDYAVPSEDPGLPDDIFGHSPDATLTFLVVLRGAEGAASILPRAFHDVVVCAQNLTTRGATVVVSPNQRVVKSWAGPDGEAGAESLEDIASGVGLAAGDLARLNAATPRLLQAGAVITVGEAGTAASWTVIPGDDLLTVAATLGVSIDEVSTAIGSSHEVLHVGAKVEVFDGWVVRRNRVSQLLGGFRMLRRRPPPVGDDAPRTVAVRYDADAGPETLDAKARIERMFNLLSYAIEEGTGFDPSTRGLPVPPAEPDAGSPDGGFAVAAGEEQPWVYDRLLPVAAWAKARGALSPSAVDPYAELGGAATIRTHFHDVFGNVLPGPGSAPLVEWPQRYRDPIIGVNLWPSTTMSYDVHRVETHDTPEIEVRIDFVPASYVSRPGERVESIRLRAARDRACFADVFHQLADTRMTMTLRTSLLPAEERPVASEALLRLVRECYGYLDVIEMLEPLEVVVEKPATLHSTGPRFGVTPSEFGATSADDAAVLQPGAPYEDPVFLKVIPNRTLDDIIEEWRRVGDGALSPEEIGRLNGTARLTPGVEVRVGDGESFPVPESMTLDEVAHRFRMTGPMLARLNQDVKGFLRQGQVILLAVLKRRVVEGDTLRSLADAVGMTLEDFLEWNEHAPFLKPGSSMEVPRHVVLPDSAREAHPDFVTVLARNESLQSLADRMGLGGALREVASANAEVGDLLRVGGVFVYAAEDPGVGSGEPVVARHTVRQHDTLATVAQSLARELGLPTLTPADVCVAPENAENRGLLHEGSLALVPPARVVMPWNVVLGERLEAGITPLTVTLEMRRSRPEFIDRSFRDAAGVAEVTLEVPPRLSSSRGCGEDTSMRAFARHFNEVFPNLFLATGPDIVETTGLETGGGGVKARRSKLLAVQWKKGWRDFEIHEDPAFFAPTPLVTELWSADNVVVYPYPPGPPPPGSTEDPPPVQDFREVDLERWAVSFLSRIDELLEPDRGAALRAASPGAYAGLAQAKLDIATAVSERVRPVYEAAAGRPVDLEKAQETFRQHLLVRLAPAYRGGTVLQFAATVDADPRWKRGSAPAVYGHASLAPAVRVPAGSSATLSWLAEHFGVPVVLVAEVLCDTSDLLAAGAEVSAGGHTTTIRASDTLGSIARRLETTLDDLATTYAEQPGLLLPGAPLHVIQKTRSPEADDTFISVITDLARSLVSRNEIDTAIRRFTLENADTPGVFAVGIEVRHGGRVAVTTESDSIRDVASALEITAEELVRACQTTFPLLRSPADPFSHGDPGADESPVFRFLTMYPPGSLSDAKLELYSPLEGEVPSTLNVVYVTSSPDDVGSVKVQLAFESSEIEYNVRTILETSGYRASEWLTFLDSSRRSELGAVEIPIVNRQFPIPPAILSQGTEALVGEEWKTQPAIEDLTKYRYGLSFAFHASPQDEITYESEYFVTPFVDDEATRASADGDPPIAEESLATLLAQFRMIDEPLWRDLSTLGSPDAGVPGEAQLRAIDVFVGLAARIAKEWARWEVVESRASAGPRYRIRKHSSPDGPVTVTVCPVHEIRARATGDATSEPDTVGRATPVARLLQLTTVSGSRGRVTSARHEAAVAPAVLTGPAPHRLSLPDRYEVTVDDLDALREQSVRGSITITRNEHLIAGRMTRSPFVLSIPDVRLSHAAVPQIVQTHSIVIGVTAGQPLSGRIERFLDDLLFPEAGEGRRRRQLVSLAMAYARPIVEGRSHEVEGAEPADTSTLFVPISMTPALDMAVVGEEHVSPGDVGRAVAARVEAWRVRKGLPASIEWALSLRLFGTDTDAQASAPLVELVDLRIGNATQ